MWFLLKNIKNISSFLTDIISLTLNNYLTEHGTKVLPTVLFIYFSSVIESIEIEYEMRKEKMRKKFFILVCNPLYSEATHYMRGRKKTKKTYTTKLQC